jgi:hypothetical protein
LRNALTLTVFEQCPVLINGLGVNVLAFPSGISSVSIIFAVLWERQTLSNVLNAPNQSAAAANNLTIPSDKTAATFQAYAQRKQPTPPAVHAIAYLG